MHGFALLGTTPITLSVVRHGDGWCVFGPNGGWRRFDYKVDAEEAALRLAHQTRGGATQVDVLTQDASGELRPLRGD